MPEEIIAFQAELIESEKKIIAMDYRVRVVLDISGTEKELMRVYKWLGDVEAKEAVIGTIARKK